jgi:glycosyltransferase involved in cell wall biosynthesis
LVPVKDFELLLEIASKITQHVENACFSILGDGPCRRNLEERAKCLGLNGHFSVLPPIHHPASYYKSLNIYLNTSLHEGIPMSVLEAMAYGVPVVAAKVGGLSEVIVDGRDGFLVEGRNPEDYVRRCVDLIENANLRYDICEAAIRRVKADFSAGRMAREYNSLYLSLLGSPSYAS